MACVFLGRAEHLYGLVAYAVKNEQLVEIYGQIRDGVISGVDECAGCGSADPHAVEDRTAVCGIGHAPRIGNSVGQSPQRRAEIIADRTDIPSS
jgi:hypothetical protein